MFNNFKKLYYNKQDNWGYIYQLKPTPSSFIISKTGRKKLRFLINKTVASFRKSHPEALWQIGVLEKTSCKISFKIQRSGSKPASSICNFLTFFSSLVFFVFRNMDDQLL